MSRNNELFAAIQTKDIEKIKVLALADFEENAALKENWPDSSEFFCAIRTSSFKVIKTLVDIWTCESPYQRPEEFAPETILEKLRFTIFPSDEELMSVLEYLLPHCYEEDPKMPGFLNINKIFPYICHSWETLYVQKTYFVQKYYYSEEHNSLYPLVKRLQEAQVDRFNSMTILLHGRLECLDEIFRHPYLMEDVLEVSMHLIIRTPEIMQLAVEILKTLLNKDLDVAMDQYAQDMYDNSYDEIKEDNIWQFSPVLLKPLFQLVYRTFDSENCSKVTCLIESWFEICSLKHRALYLLCQSFVPFVVSIPILDVNIRLQIMENEFEKLLQLFPQTNEEFKTLKYFCKYKVTKIIAEASNSQPHEAIKRLWSLPLPVTLKCEMLHIPDASWMDNLPVMD